MSVCHQHNNNGVQDEDNIISRFYEERKNREGNSKYHNLLKKNISLFHPQPSTHQYMETGQGHGHNDSVASVLDKTVASVLDKHSRRRHSISTSSPANHTYSPLPILTPTIPKPPSTTPQPPQSHHSQSQYRQQLKQHLNKRININDYLAQLQNITHNKQNISMQQQQTIPQHHYRSLEEKEYNNRRHQERSYKCLEEYRQIEYQNIQGENKHVEQNSNSQHMHQNSNRHSLCLDNTGKVSKNTQRTYKQGSIYSSAKRKMSLHSQQTPKQHQPPPNILNNHELTQLQQNSHPLRQNNHNQQNIPPTSQYPEELSAFTLKYKYEDRQEGKYQKKIEELEEEIRELKGRHKREEKFISSIQKMRNTMVGQEGECSLKELWRWIKTLPK